MMGIWCCDNDNLRKKVIRVAIVSALMGVGEGYADDTPPDSGNSTPRGQQSPGGSVSSTPRGQQSPGGSVSSTPRGQQTPGGDVPDGGGVPDEQRRLTTNVLRMQGELLALNRRHQENKQSLAQTRVALNNMPQGYHSRRGAERSVQRLQQQIRDLEQQRAANRAAQDQINRTLADRQGELAQANNQRDQVTRLKAERDALQRGLRDSRVTRRRLARTLAEDSGRLAGLGGPVELVSTSLLVPSDTASLASGLSGDEDDNESVVSMPEEDAIRREHEVEENMLAQRRALQTLQEDTAAMAAGQIAQATKALIEVGGLTQREITRRLEQPDRETFGKSMGDGFENTGLWGRYIYHSGTQKKDGNDPKYDSSINGVVLGVDAELNEQIKVGAAFTYANTDIKAKDIGDASQSIKGDHYMGTLYTGWNEGPWFANGQLSYGMAKNTYKMTVLDSEGKNDADGSVWGISAGGGYNWRLNDEWVFQPRAEFNFASVALDKYTLKASSGNEIELKAKEFQKAEMGTGFRLIGSMTTEQGMIINPVFSVMGFYDMADSHYEFDMSAPYLTFDGKVDGQKRDRGRGVVGMGVNCELNDNLSLGLGYDFDYSKHYTGHSLQAQVEYTF